MLRELHIRNFALIEQLELSFYSGFSVLTGETGAGKSIIIDALGLLIGGRASSEMIRTGADSAEVEGSFLVPHIIRPQLGQWGVEVDDELIISREIYRNGRNKCRLNGRLATVGQLSEIGPYLVEIVGQHDSQNLMNPQSHLSLLDAFGGVEHMNLVRQTEELYQQWHEIRAEKNRLQRDERERNRRIDLLKYQIEEIEMAQLQQGEEEALSNESRRLANMDRIRQSAQMAFAILNENVGNQESVMRQLNIGEAELLKASGLDETLEPLVRMYSDSVLAMEEVSRELRDYIEGLPDDPERLNEIQTRLDLIENLKRKYGANIDEILQYSVQAQSELEDLENSKVRFDQLEEESAVLNEQWMKEAKRLSVSRREIAEALEKRIEAELADLNMTNTQFVVSFMELEEIPQRQGLEAVEFMIAPNLGEDLKPLAKIASGGELSRLMLAVKAILVEADQTPTVIFDEIDAGIGGRTALNLAQKLRSLSENCQVLCVTHLPVIASYGTNHYSVQKKTMDKRTTVEVDKLSPETRIAELTRMLGGTSDETTTSEHAKELLRRAYGS
ncbi:MAG: DNA repair protein RecN [Firmicutes bacterium]|nr:DNA repair protein RecN [Bacillota bacterium]